MYSFGTYQFDRLASVAQSAERNHGKVEVSGSIPLGGYNLIIRGKKWLARKRLLLKL